MRVEDVLIGGDGLLDRFLLARRGDPVGRAKRVDFLGDLRGIVTIFGLDLALVRLHELGCGTAKSKHELRLHALFHQRLPRLVNDVQLREQGFPIAVGEIKRDLNLAQSGKDGLIVGTLRIGRSDDDGKDRDGGSSDRTDAMHVFLPLLVAEARGLPDDKIATIVAGQRPSDLSREEAVAYDVAAALVSGGLLPELTCRQAVTLFSENGTAELINLIGLYCAVSVILNEFARALSGAPEVGDVT